MEPLSGNGAGLRQCGSKENNSWLLSRRVPVVIGFLIARTDPRVASNTHHCKPRAAFSQELPTCIRLPR